ncbi:MULTISPECIES: transposase [Pseudooceanicola]|uniref:transposase n=1 Tax=Pseudooceanicola TaxID=1679449 RepID=UPI001EF01055|nr:MULTISPECIES: transposase [Pseudooceanicola]
MVVQRGTIHVWANRTDRMTRMLFILREIVLIHDLKRQGVSAIARQIYCDGKTVRKYLDLGLEPPIYGSRPPRGSKLDGYHAYLLDRGADFPGPSGRRLFRELQGKGYESGKFWTKVLSDLRNRRVQERLIAVVVGLKGFRQVIKAALPRTRILTCIVHLLRYSMNFNS